MDIFNFTERARDIFFLRQEQSQIEDWVRRLSLYVPDSDQEEETYVYSMQTAGLEPWRDGPRRIRSVIGHKFKVENIDYADAVEIKVRDMRHDKFRIFDQELADVADAADLHPNERAIEVMQNLESLPCIDGENFFDTDHVVGNSGIQSNIHTFNVADATKPTPAEFARAVWQAIIRQRGFKDARGKRFTRGKAKYLVAVPTNLLDVAMDALNANLHVNGTAAVADNTLKNQTLFSVEIIDIPDMIDTWGSGDFQFGLFREDGSGEVFVWQEEVPPFLDLVGGANEHRRFHHNSVAFGAQRTYGFAPLHWFKGVLTKFNTAP